MSFRMHDEAESRNSYRVEVSGWDALENFFVEKTTLRWDRGADKEVSLSSSVREGCMVFVRLLRRAAIADTIPTAYRVTELGIEDGTGRATARLVQVYPRSALKRPVPAPTAIQ